MSSSRAPGCGSEIPTRRAHGSRGFDVARATWLWWSSGKDSAWALHRMLDDANLHVTGLVTTLDSHRAQVPLHGTGSDLLELQATSTGLPLELLLLPSPCSNEAYVASLGELALRARQAGVECMAFGDLHLADVRSWRDGVFAELGFATHYPLWGTPTDALARAMLEGGLRALITGVDLRVLEPSWLGRPFDQEFLTALPHGVDPCGERGEFHTFVTAGPMFASSSLVEEGLDVQCGPPQREGDFAWVEPVLAFPVDGTLDLHGVAPREVGDLVDDYLDACGQRGIDRVRIVHGKGIGALRETVHARLRRRDDVVGFELGGESGGGWGATIVRLRGTSG